MINWALYKREMKVSIKLLLIFGAIITMYVSCIISLYNPATMEMLDSFAEAMPEIMAAVGMTPGAADLLGFMVSYLYGFILLIFPMLFSILRGHGLVAKYIDTGSMVYLVGAPIKRRTIVMTQLSVLVSGIIILIAYTTVVEIVVAQMLFLGQLQFSELMILNLGLLFLHFSIGGICFGASCIFSETKFSVLFGAGIPTIMYVFQMLASAGSGIGYMKYLSIFTLFDPNELIAFESNALLKIIILLMAAFVFYSIGTAAFCKKDLHI